MASSEARITAALLFSFSAVVLLLLARSVLLQPPPQPQTRRRGADLVLAALDRVLDGRAILRLATRTNIVLLCHAILLLILRDAGVLGAPARRRRGASPPAAARVATVVAAAAAVDSEAENDACSAAAPRPSSRSVVVWRRRPRDATRNMDIGESGRRHVKRQPRRSPRQAAVPAVLTQEPEQLEWHAQAISREIVIVDKVPTATNQRSGDNGARATGDNSDLDRRVVVAGDGRKARDAAEQMAAGVELADDRRIEEFIANQWSMMRQESLQLVRSGSQQAMTT